jgi:hypothetical protein
MSERDATSSLATGRGGAARLAAALTILVASAPPAGAMRGPLVRRLDVLTASQGRVWFLQPDGKGTTIDITTGAVTRGGASHHDWPQPRRCDDRDPFVCPLAAGALTSSWIVEVKHAERERVLDLRSEKGHWQAIHRRSLGPPGSIWELEGALLIESPKAWTTTLECLDISSGRARWIYAYPTWPGSSTWTPMGDRGGVDAAREQLRRSEGEVRQRGAGTYDPSDDALARPYAGKVVLDPDPMRWSAVRAGMVLGWGAVGVALALAVMRIMGRPAGHHFTALVIGLAVVIVAVGLIDPILVAALWLVFLAVFVVATADKGARRGLLWTVVVVTAVIVWVPSYVASIQR